MQKLTPAFIKAKRTELHLNQRDFGKLVGVSQRTISLMEVYADKITKRSERKLIKALGISSTMLNTLAQITNANEQIIEITPKSIKAKRIELGMSLLEFSKILNISSRALWVIENTENYAHKIKPSTWQKINKAFNLHFKENVVVERLGAASEDEPAVSRDLSQYSLEDLIQEFNRRGFEITVKGLANSTKSAT